jgi:metallo-beta-lactamase family protein
MTTPTISFLGAARNVTGSRFLLEDGTTRVLVDCGLYQERDLATRNWDHFPVEASSIDAVLLTHAHLDHSGYLPRLVADGFQGPVYCTEATADIVAILLEDSARIQTEDAAFKKRRHQKESRKGYRPEVPLYTVDDAVNAISHLTPVAYGERVAIGGFAATFADAGHILGSATVQVGFGQGPEAKTIVFSGDLGRVAGPLLHDPAPYAHADYVVVESTYGDRKHRGQGNAMDAVAEAINATVKRGGNVLIPSFAVERAQDLLVMLKTMVETKRIPHLMFFVDSPMATDVTRVFERYPELLDPELAQKLDDGDSPFRFADLNFVKTVEESKAINNIRGTAVIIAGSGMCTGGRIKHHLVNNIEDPNTTVLFVGYQAYGTLGRLLVDGAETVRIQGQQRDVRAQIVQVNGMSAHADVDGLRHWLGALESAPSTVFVVHGEEESALGFAETLATDFGWETIAPEFGQTFELA